MRRPVHIRHQIRKTVPDWDLGDVAAPNLIGPCDRQLSQQVWINAVLRFLLVFGPLSMAATP